MNLLVGMVAGVLVAVGVCAYGVVFGRRGTTKPHRAAFTAGVAGLVAVPLWFLGLAGLLSQLFWTKMMSPAGILLLSTSVVLLVATGTVIQASAVLRSTPNG